MSAQPPLLAPTAVIAERLTQIHLRTYPTMDTRRHDAFAIIGALRQAGWAITRARHDGKAP